MNIMGTASLQHNVGTCLIRCYWSSEASHKSPLDSLTESPGLCHFADHAVNPETHFTKQEASLTLLGRKGEEEVCTQLK